MIYIKWTFLLIVNISTNYLINFPLAPIVVLFANKDGWLPYCLWWFQTPDNSLDGDYLWQTQRRPYLSENNRYKRWVNRFSWLHRNKLYGFSASVLSVKYDRVDDVFTRDGSTEVRDTPSPALSGLVVRRLYNETGKLKAFQYYYIRQWKRWPTKCIRLNVGWKLWSWEDGHSVSASFVFSPALFKKFDQG